MKVAHVDVETFSELDIKAGSHEYFRHPSTELLCVCYQIGEEVNGKFESHKTGEWLPGDPAPSDLVNHINAGLIVWAHNAEFERDAVNFLTNWGSPVKIEQIQCTLALAACNSLPLSLDKLGACLGISRPKDKEGKKIMMKLCKPDKEGVRLRPTEEELKTLLSYCHRDVEAEIDICDILPSFTPMQIRAYRATAGINTRGIPLDTDLVQACQKAREDLNIQADAIAKSITGQGIELLMSPLKLMIWLSSKGVDLKNAQRQTLEDLLQRDDIETDVRIMVEQRLIVSSTSLKKFDVMEVTSGSDRRVRGTLQFHSAFTGRWGGRLIQPQNFPRPSIKPLELEGVRDDILETPVADADTLRSFIRHSVRAPEGKEFICADWSNIEGRMLAYLAGEEWKLKAFQDYDDGKGHDLYKLAYAKSFNINPDDVTDDQRAIGKVQELALGYGGGAGAIEQFAKDKFSEGEKESMKKKYRKANKKIERFWYALESAAVKAVKSPTQKIQKVGRLEFKFAANSLYIKLLSGRCIRYPIPKIEIQETPWGEDKEVLSYMKYDKGQWLRTHTWGGKLAENVTQAACACLMMEALDRFDNIVMSVHDEIVCEIDEGTGNQKEFEEKFSIVPKWAEGLPVSSEGWIGKYYRK
jgi:DNA polymerase